MQGTLHEFYITPDHYHNDAIKDIRSLQRCFFLHRDLSQISCQEGGYHLLSSSIYHAQAPSPNECVCMSECTICKSLCWVIERGVDTVCGCGSMCVINLYKRGSIVSTTVLSDLPWNQWMLCLLLSLFILLFCLPKWDALFFSSSLVWTNHIIPAVRNKKLK